MSFRSAWQHHQSCPHSSASSPQNRYPPPVGTNISEYTPAYDRRKNSPGQTGELRECLGSVIITQLEHAAYSHAQAPFHQRKQFHLYVDEFQRFVTEEFALFLTQPARKFGLGITIAHQYRRQMETGNRNASLAAANLMVFQVLPKDGQELAYQFDTPLHQHPIHSHNNNTPTKSWHR